MANYNPKDWTTGVAFKKTPAMCNESAQRMMLEEKEALFRLFFGAARYDNCTRQWVYGPGKTLEDRVREVRGHREAAEKMVGDEAANVFHRMWPTGGEITYRNEECKSLKDRVTHLEAALKKGQEEAEARYNMVVSAQESFVKKLKMDHQEVKDALNSKITRLQVDVRTAWRDASKAKEGQDTARTISARLERDLMEAGADLRDQRILRQRRETQWGTLGVAAGAALAAATLKAWPTLISLFTW